MARKLTIKVAATNGGIDKFKVTVGKDTVIATDGTKTPVWSGSVADHHVPVTFQAIGMANGSYEIILDLERVMSNQHLQLSLVSGHSELQMVL